MTLCQKLENLDFHQNTDIRLARINLLIKYFQFSFFAILHLFSFTKKLAQSLKGERIYILCAFQEVDGSINFSLNQTQYNNYFGMRVFLCQRNFDGLSMLVKPLRATVLWKAINLYFAVNISYLLPFIFFLHIFFSNDTLLLLYTQKCSQFCHKTQTSYSNYNNFVEVEKCICSRRPGNETVIPNWE